MNIQCPNCETVFDLQKKEKSNRKYKCIVCNHIWIESINEDKQPQNSNYLKKSNLKKIIILNITIFLLVILGLIIFRNDLEDVDIYWKNFYLFFDTLIPIQ